MQPQQNTQHPAYGLFLAYGAVVKCTRVIVERAYQLAATEAEKRPGDESDVFLGSLIRVLFWLKTLSRLDEPSDYQAAGASTRACLEVAIDLVLLRHDSTNDFAKMVAWEKSAKVHVAKKLVDYLAETGKPVPPRLVDKEKHYRTQLANVTALRRRYWPNKKDPTKARHPSRWTGRELAEDAKVADVHYSGGDFYEFCNITYPELHWYVHGSALLGQKGVRADMVPFIAAQMFEWTSRFAIVASDLVMQHFGCWNASTVAEFDGLKEECKSVRLGMFHAHQHPPDEDE
jgi:hypothetical protein